MTRTNMYPENNELLNTNEMRKVRLLYLFALSLLMITSACRRDNDPEPPNPMIGRWDLDRIVLSNLPAEYQSSNRSYTPSVFGFERDRFDFKTDNSFTRDIRSGVIVTAEGSWTLNTEQTRLTLRYDDGDEEEYTLNNEKTELSYGENVNINLGTAEEPRSVPGRVTFVYIKQTTP
jgi:hypothetical protein